MRVFVFACVALVALIASAVSASDFYSGKGNKVLNLTPESFEEQVLKSDKVWFVEFYAPWCGHCKNLAPHWSAAAKAMYGTVSFGAVDADAHSALGSKYQVQGYPTLLVFGADKSAEPKAYEGQRTTDALVEAAIAEITALTDKRLGKDKKKEEQKQQQQQQEQQKPPAGGFYEGTDVVELTDETFESEVLNGKDAWLVEFYAPWCGHCKSLTPHWKAAAAADTGIKVAAIDATAHSKFSNKFGVQGFPTIKFFKPSSPDQTPEEYNSGRDTNAIVAYLNDKAALYPVVRKPVEVPQVVEQAELEAKCLSKTLCVVFVLPHVADTTAAGRTAMIETLGWVAAKFKSKPAAFVWIAGTDNYKFEGKFGIEAAYPTFVGMNKERNRFYVHRGAKFDQDALTAELTNLFDGRAGMSAWKEPQFPALSKGVQLWDGKDYVAPVDDE
jgi:protein disulfide-isomerase A6